VRGGEKGKEGGGDGGDTFFLLCAWGGGGEGFCVGDSIGKKGGEGKKKGKERKEGTRQSPRFFLQRKVDFFSLKGGGEKRRGGNGGANMPRSSLMCTVNNSCSLSPVSAIRKKKRGKGKKKKGEKRGQSRVKIW